MDIPTGYTPKPWKVEPSADPIEKGIAVLADRGTAGRDFMIAWVHQWASTTTEELLDTAALIALAPELAERVRELEATVEAMKVECDRFTPEWFTNMREAYEQRST